MEVLINNNTNENIEEFEPNILKVIDKTLEIENFTKNVEVSVVFVDNENIKSINKKFRNKNVETDVLSFPMIDDFDNINFDNVVLLGDIIISIEKAKEQSKDFGHSFSREIAFLTAHSMLHLLGYDHIDTEDEKIMIQKQKKIMEMVNINR